MDLPFAAGVDRSPLAAGLLAGDAAVIVVLLSGGMVRHGVDPLASPGYAAQVVGPFLVAWVAAAVALGAYLARTRSSVRDAVVNVAGTWVVAALGGAALRATPFLPGNAPPSFVAVVAGFGAVALAAWRGAVTHLLRSGGR